MTGGAVAWRLQTATIEPVLAKVERTATPSYVADLQAGIVSTVNLGIWNRRTLGPEHAGNRNFRRKAPTRSVCVVGFLGHSEIL